MFDVVSLNEQLRVAETSVCRARLRAGRDDVCDTRQGIHHGVLLERLRHHDGQLPDVHASCGARLGGVNGARWQHGVVLRRRNTRASFHFYFTS